AVTTDSTTVAATTSATTTVASLATTTSVAATTTSRAAPTTTTTVAPAPTSYAVGTHTVTLVDSSRSTPANVNAPGPPDRTLPTLAVYPAPGGRGAGRPGDAPRAGAPYGSPLAVSAQGLTSTGGASLPFLSRLAAAGFVVAAPDFPLSRHDAPGGATGRLQA